MSDSSNKSKREGDEYSSVTTVIATAQSIKYSILEAILKHQGVLTQLPKSVLRGAGFLPGALFNAVEGIDHLDKGENLKAAGSLGALIGGGIATFFLGGGVLAGAAGGLLLAYLGKKGAEFLADPAEGMRALGQDYIGPAAKFATEKIDSVARPATEALGKKLEAAGKEYGPKLQAATENLGGHIEKGLEPVSVAAKEYVAPAVAKLTTEYVAPAAKTATENVIAPAAEKLTTGVIGPAAQGFAESVSSAIQGFFSLFKDDPKPTLKNEEGQKGSSEKVPASKASISGSNKIGNTTQTKQAGSNSPGTGQTAQNDFTSINSEISLNPKYFTDAKPIGSIVDRATNTPAININPTNQDPCGPGSGPVYDEQNHRWEICINKGSASPSTSSSHNQQPNQSPVPGTEPEDKPGNVSLLRNVIYQQNLNSDFLAATGAGIDTSNFSSTGISVNINQSISVGAGADVQQVHTAMNEANIKAQNDWESIVADLFRDQRRVEYGATSGVA